MYVPFSLIIAVGFVAFMVYPHLKADKKAEKLAMWRRVYQNNVQALGGRDFEKAARLTDQMLGYDEVSCL